MSLAIGHPGTRLRLKVPYSGPPPSVNEKLHWATLKARLDPWRVATAMAARDYRGPRPFAPSLLRMTWPSANRIRKDPHNFVMVVKACIDVLISEGFWPDDTAEFITLIDPRIVHMPGLDDPTTGLAGRAHALIDIVPIQRLTDALATSVPELVDLFKIVD